jgi:hypothetical protein
MTDSQAPKTRSTFVSVVAWIFIAFSGFATLISLLQNVMFQFVFDSEQFGALSSSENVPELLQVFFSNPELLLAAMLFLTSLFLVSSIGLLLRKNWARVSIICLLCFGVVWNVASLFIMAALFDDFAMSDFPQDDEFDRFLNIMRVFNIAMMIGISGLMGWIAYKLCTRSIREEFA